ncbi:hypothetical protein D7D25_09455 [Proteiniphilum sp. X52]|nr:hypothetical protein D7D25_09455 [Proteiniphilum sp. X52]
MIILRFLDFQLLSPAEIIRLSHRYISASVKFLALDPKKKGNSKKFLSFIFRVEKKAIYLQSKILLINNRRYYY